MNKLVWYSLGIVVIVGQVLIILVDVVKGVH
jgi:hypothetical protein